MQPSVYGTNNAATLDALRTYPERLRAVAVVEGGIADAELEEMHRLGVRGAARQRTLPRRVGFDLARRLAERVAPLGWHLQFLIDISKSEGYAAQLASLPVDSVIVHEGELARPAALSLIGAMAATGRRSISCFLHRCASPQWRYSWCGLRQRNWFRPGFVPVNPPRFHRRSPRLPNEFFAISKPGDRRYVFGRHWPQVPILPLQPPNNQVRWAFSGTSIAAEVHPGFRPEKLAGFGGACSCCVLSGVECGRVLKVRTAL